MGSMAYITLALIFNLSIAALSFHFLESPILRMKNKFSYTTEGK
jgi:hypothetical protein